LTGALTNLRLWGGVLAAMVAGLVADALIKALRPSAENTAAARIIAFVTGLVFSAAYLIAIGIFHGRTYPIDLAIGTIGLTGIACLTLSAVALAPAGPEKYATSDEAEEAEEAVAAAPAIPVAPAAMPMPMPLPPMPAPAPVPAARPRPVDPAILRLANKVAGTAATRERPIETTVLCQLLRGASVAEVAGMYEPALDTADVDELVTETDGAYATWARESLENSDVVYLYLEAISTNSADDLLAAWGVTRHGRRVLLGLRAGDPERATAWGALGVDLVERGLPTPALVIADGAPGVWRTVGELWPEAAQQQSLTHALAEAAEGLSDRDARELRNGFAAALEGARSAEEATGKLEEIVDALRDEAPARMAVLARRIERLTAHLDYPTEHHRRIRSADALQRGLSEVGVDASVPLVWTVINRNTEGARRMAMSLHAAARIDQLRRRPAPVHNHEASEIEA
jgi:hypothetical protein